MSAVHIKTIDKDLSVSKQITIADLQAIKSAGFRSLICNRPDGEDADQPHFSDIKHAAEQLGLACHHLPIVSGQVSLDDAYAFTNILRELNAPTLAYCRSGMRCITLWALANRNGMAHKDIVCQAKELGYDLEPVLTANTNNEQR